jgi:GT2 family glycosyltransferase
VQFLDGDCELVAGWPQLSMSFLRSRPGIAAVCGRLRERHPERSVYNWLCDLEWNGPTGEIKACAGNVVMRAEALKVVGGYRDDVIAAEEDELCVRLRAAGWKIWRLEQEMALHDAAMMRFSQWWRRSTRTGYAFAQGAHLHGRTAERHFVRQSRRAWIWGIALPLASVGAVIISPSWGWLVLLTYPLQFARLAARPGETLSKKGVLAFFHIITRFPEALGQLLFLRDRVFQRIPRAIEHK